MKTRNSLTYILKFVCEQSFEKMQIDNLQRANCNVK
jgi:hypothetical protein